MTFTPPMCDQHPLIAAYELGELWAMLGYQYSLLNAFPDDDDLLGVYNSQITAIAPRFEQVFQQLRPAEVGQFFQRLRRSNPTQLDTSSGPLDSILGELQRAFEQTGDLNHVRQEFDINQRQGVHYRDLTLGQMLARVGQEVQSRIRAFTLGQRMSECLFPRDISTRLFEIRLDDVTQEEVLLLTHRPDRSAILLTDEALRGVREALWQLQQPQQPDHITPLRNQTHSFLNRQVTDAENDFRSLRKSILEVLQSLPEVAAQASPSSSQADEVKWRDLRVNCQTKMMIWPDRQSIPVEGGPQLRLLLELIQANGHCAQQRLVEQIWLNTKNKVDRYPQLRKIRSSLNRQLCKLFGTIANGEISHLVAANPNGGKEKYGPACMLTLKLPEPPAPSVELATSGPDTQAGQP